MSQPQASKGQGLIPLSERKQERGVVKAVPSGNSIVVVEKLPSGPVEKEILLANIDVPRLPVQSRPQEQPFSWQAREFLRKKAIGKAVTFTIINKINDRLYSGSVVLNSTNEDLSQLMVKEGWADIYGANEKKDIRDELRELYRLKEAAQADGKGMWTTIDEAKNSAVRVIPPELDIVKEFDKYKGVPLQAIIEYVRTGSTLKATLLPSFQNVVFSLAGAQSPGWKKVTKSATAPTSAAAAAAQQESFEPEPMAPEALAFTQHHALHRDAIITFEARDKSRAYASVVILGHDLSEELIKAGLAVCVDWSASKAALPKLKAAETAAKAAKLRIWLHGAPTIAAPEKPKEEVNKPAPPSEFVGRVVATSNTGAVIVMDPLGNERRMLLSSLRIPSGMTSGKRGEVKRTVPDFGGKKKEEDEDHWATYEPWAFEAKELLRTKLAGKKVKVIVDYVVPENKEKQLSEREYCTIFVDGSKNVAELLVEEGLATVFEHGSGDRRSTHYDALLSAETRAKQAGKGLHSRSDKAPIHFVNDLSKYQQGPDRTKAHNKSVKFLPFLQKEGKLKGVVEHVFSATRVKIYLDKHNVLIPFSLASIQRLGDEDEQYIQKANTWTRNKVNGRDVEIEIEGVDKGGNFMGTLWVKRKNLGAALLAQGFARVGYTKGPYAAELLSAEEKAKRAKKHTWANYDEEEEARKKLEEKEAELERQAAQQKKTSSIEVVVTEIVDLSKFYIQVVSEAVELENLMASIAESNPDSILTAAPSKAGDLCLAKFTVDDSWYRARILKVAGDRYTVLYIDYGNTEIIPKSRVKPLVDVFRKLPAQAVEVALAYLKPPHADDELFHEAVNFFKDLALSKQCLMNVEYTSDEKKHVTLADIQAKVHVNAALLRQGLATIVKKLPRSVIGRPVLDMLKEEQEKAHNLHLNLWQYGDPDDEDQTL